MSDHRPPRALRPPGIEGRATVAALADHPRHLALAALVAGLLCGPRWPSVLAALAGAALAVAAARTTRAPGAGIAVLVAVALLAGGVIARERLRALDRTELRPQASFTARGVALEPVRTRAFGVQVVPVELRGGPGEGERVLVRAQARVAVRADTGEEVVARGSLRDLRPREGFERRRGIHAVLEADSVARTGRRRGSPLDDLRRRAERALSAGLGGEQAALARGMVLGQDHALPADLRDAFRASGLAHLVAASGQNVMLLAALVIAAATAAGAMLRTRLALALAAVVLYVPLAGAGPSIQRAGVMGAAGLTAALAGRPASRWYALLLAAAATLVLNPRAADDPGWQLSFAAVVAILALHRRLRDALTARGSPRALAEVAALTIAATAATAPHLALHFEQVSLVSLPANVLAAPAVAPVMWLGVTAAALGGPVAPVLNAIAAVPLAYLAWLGRAAAALPHASVPVSLPGPAGAAAAYAVLGLGAFIARRAPRTAAALLVAGIVAVAAGWGRVDPPRGFALSVLDVGQGDAILLQHGRAHAILVDTGPPGAGVAGKLRAAGVRRLDALLLTHSSRDHEGGLAEVLAALPVDLVVDGRQTAEERGGAEGGGAEGGGAEGGGAEGGGAGGGGAAGASGAPTEGGGGEGGGVRFEGLPPGVARAVPEAGQTIRAGPLALRILWPPPGASRAGDPNATATVALAHDGETEALLTADAESPVTLPLDLPDIDVLKVAHHGSEDAGLRELLQRTSPEVAVVPVGRNTYGHPAPSTLAALRGVPTVARTDVHGTVRVEPASGGRVAVTD